MISGTGDAQRELVQRENEREKEREIARRDLARRDLARSTVHEIAINANGASRDHVDDRDPTARSREALIVIDASRDRTVDRNPRS